MKSILDPSFRYTASFDTDLQKTFERIRRDRRDEAVPAVRRTGDAPVKDAPIIGKTAKDRLCGVQPVSSS